MVLRWLSNMLNSLYIKWLIIGYIILCMNILWLLNSILSLIILVVNLFMLRLHILVIIIELSSLWLILYLHVISLMYLILYLLGMQLIAYFINDRLDEVHFCTALFINHSSEPSSVIWICCHFHNNCYKACCYLLWIWNLKLHLICKCTFRYLKYFNAEWLQLANKIWCHRYR